MKHRQWRRGSPNSSNRTSHELERPEPRPRNEAQSPPGEKRRSPSSDPSEIIFGVVPVRELIAAAPSRIRNLYLKGGSEGRFASEIKAVNAVGGRVLPVTADVLQQMAGSEARHQGIIAAVREYEYSSLEDVVAEEPDPLLILDGVTDPRNLGAILRCAECAGLKAIVLAKDRTVAMTPASVKSSAGAWAHMKVARCGNVAQSLGRLKDSGYWIAAMDPGGETSIYDLDTTRHLALVLGSEGRGIRPIVRKTVDFVVRIPVHGRVASLNVSVAAAIALFEIARKRAIEPRS